MILHEFKFSTYITTVTHMVHNVQQSGLHLPTICLKYIMQVSTSFY